MIALSALVLTVGCKQAPKNSMTYRQLGNTGLEVSEISIGCGGFEKLDTAGSIALMDMALDSGMNYIDIYDANPKTRSNIGAALKGRRDKMIIQGHATWRRPSRVLRTCWSDWAPTTLRWA